MNDEAAQLIRGLGLNPLPGEGGFFVQTWLSADLGPGGRPIGSAILFLITEADFSALHRLKTPEIWHFHAGDPAELVLLGPGTRQGRIIVLGSDLSGGHAAQAVVPGGTWQGARLKRGNPKPRGWALFGCTMSPAWDASECEFGERSALLADYPDHADLVRALTRVELPR